MVSLRRFWFFAGSGARAVAVVDRQRGAVDVVEAADVDRGIVAPSGLVPQPKERTPQVLQKRWWTFFLPK